MQFQSVCIFVGLSVFAVQDVRGRGGLDDRYVSRGFASLERRRDPHGLDGPAEAGALHGAALQPRRGHDALLSQTEAPQLPVHRGASQR